MMDDNQPQGNEWDDSTASEEDTSPSQDVTPTEEQVQLLPEYQMSDLPEGIQAGFNKLGWTSLMPVQARAIPYILAHRDLMIQSRTGSGKTGAYLVPILQRINPDLNATQALVLVPTRELAVQVIREAETLSSATPVRTVAVYGGVGYGQQLDAFRQGAHLVVGTPGRILDHLLRRSLSLDRLKILVFDEADRMLSMGFYPDMKRVQRYLPTHPVSAYMFSATYPPRVIGLANEFMHLPEFLNLSSDHVHVTEVEHVFYSVPAMGKERSLINVIEYENPASAIVFCNTRERVHFVATILQRYGYNVAEISSDLSQIAREEVMQRIRDGNLRFMVATDVASRGIDIPDLSHVFLYEAPEDPESYIHRAGRTGRAGSGGVAISLVNALEKVELNRIAKRFQIDLQERPLPADEEVQAVIYQRVTTLLEARLRERDRLQSERMQRFIPFLHELMDREEAEPAALPETASEAEAAAPDDTESAPDSTLDSTALAGIAMLLDDFYHEAFHTAQKPPIEGSQTGKGAAEAGRGANPRRKDHRSSSSRSRGSAPQGRSETGSDARQPSSPAGEAQPAARGDQRRRRRGGRGSRGTRTEQTSGS